MEHINMESYYTLLKSLPVKNKLSLIHMLTDDLVTTKGKAKINISKLYGAFRSLDSAEEIIGLLRKSRSAKRRVNL